MWTCQLCGKKTDWEEMQFTEEKRVCIPCWETIEDWSTHLDLSSHQLFDHVLYGKY